jgi:hypothetical protein
MSEKDKDELPRLAELEHLAKLADDRWREYDSKSQAEWKLSYGIWAALLAATGALLSRPTTNPLSCSWLVPAAFVFVAAAFIVHGLFLNWIQQKLRALRLEMISILKRRRGLLNLSVEESEEDKSGRISMYIQLSITALLGVLLIGTAYLVGVKP